jgi:rhamnulose-1-phosphate aldolase
MTIEAVLGDFAEVAGHLWNLGWAEASAGNLSVDVTDAGVEPATAWTCTTELTNPLPRLAGRQLLVTATGSRFRDLARGPAAHLCLVEVSRSGTHCRSAAIVDGVATLRPTSELASHLRVQAVLRERCPEHRAILHTHPTHLAALSHLSRCSDGAELNRLLWSIHPEVKILCPRGAALLGYVRPGSDELGAATARAVSDGNDVVLWRFHGCVVHATDATTALDRLHVLDKAARMVLLCRAAGERWDGLDDADLDELVCAFDLPG